MLAIREGFTPRHAVTHETTKDGAKIVADQVVTAEADMRPAAEPAPAATESPALSTDSVIEVEWKPGRARTASKE
jgi:hypothetical protein